MLWILLGVFVLMIIAGIFNSSDELMGGGFVGFVVFLVITGIVLFRYNNPKSTVNEKIAVLEQRNEEVLAQIEPVVNKYLEYESSTLMGFKVDASKVIALSMYPELKGNEMLQEQLAIIKENQKDITKLKLEEAGLKAYNLWLFME